jgi:sugar/nucleoside kinase (ribokinase family)
MDAVVIGNAALDVLCYPVNDVPRTASLSFQQSSIAAGGCGSNTAIGLSALGISTALVTCIGEDMTASLLEMAWEKVGIDCRYVRRNAGMQTGVSVGLLDTACQPRFLHSSGASAGLTVESLDLEDMVANGARWLHTAGYFILPGLMNEKFPTFLKRARSLGITISMDVVESPQMDTPSYLWECLPLIDFFMCNQMEAHHLTGETDPWMAVSAFQSYGAQAVIIKLGAEGVLIVSPEFTGEVPSMPGTVIDTTGAGDAFAAGFVASSLGGKGIEEACRVGNTAGRRMIGSFGAVSGWFRDFDS